MIEIGQNPRWIREMLAFLQPYEDRVVHSRMFEEIKQGTLSVERIQTALVYFYPLVESFPAFMAVIMSRIPLADSEPNKSAREWLIRNMGLERLHTRWWKDWAIDFGVAATVFDSEIYPPPGIEGLNNYLWRTCTYRSLPEAIGAVNFAIEGPTGIWARDIVGSLTQYNGKGARVSKRTLRWVERHANYDDRHPLEALEIIKAYALTMEQQGLVTQAVKGSLEYYAMALDHCYSLTQASVAQP